MNTKDKEEYKLLHKQYIDANAIGGDALKKYEASDDYKRYTEYNSSDDEEVLKMLGEVEEEFKDYVYEPNKNKIYEDPFISGRDVKGLKEKGNIDLTKRPIAKNSDGSISTVRSISVEFDGEQVLIPTVSDDGKVLSDEEAIEEYKKTGKHLGKFSSSEDATKYSKELHGTQALYYGEGVEQNVNYTPKENLTEGILIGQQPIEIKDNTLNSIVSPPPPPNPNTTSTQNNGEVNPNATEEGEKNPVDTKTTEDTGGETETEEKKPDTETKEEEVAEMKEKLIQEQMLAQAKAEKEKRERYDAAMKEIVEAMGDNVKTNERDIVGNRIYNDVFSLGEYLHNKNEPKYQGTATEDTALIVGDRLAADTAIEQINRSKAATVKQLAAAGRHDMIPSVLKEASNKKAELQQNIDNANAQLGMQVKQLNQQSFNQGIELGMKASQFDAQMDAQHEALRGAAMSQNLSNLRDSHRDMTNSLTANRDNKVSYAMYRSALDNPDVLESIQNFMKYKRNRNKRQNVEQQMQDTGQQ